MVLFLRSCAVSINKASPIAWCIDIGKQPPIEDNRLKKLADSLPPLQVLMSQACCRVHSKDQSKAHSESRRLTAFLEKEGFNYQAIIRAEEKSLLQLLQSPERKDGIPIAVLALLLERMASVSRCLPPLRKEKDDVP